MEKKVWQKSFFSVDCPNHTLVGGAGVIASANKTGYFHLVLIDTPIFLFIVFLTEKTGGAAAPPLPMPMQPK